MPKYPCQNTLRTRLELLSESGVQPSEELTSPETHRISRHYGAEEFQMLAHGRELLNLAPMGRDAERRQSI